MTVARHYIMTAKQGGSAQLETALSNLADAVRKVAGSEGVELLRDAFGNQGCVDFGLPRTRALATIWPRKHLRPCVTQSMGRQKAAISTI